MIRAVAWDVDGTLVDSEGLHHFALVTVSARYAVPVAEDDTRFVGVAMEDVWAQLQPQYPPALSWSAWLDEINQVYLAHSAGLRATPGALAAMRRLERSGVRQCCVSNSHREIVDANLAAIGARPFVEFALSRNDVARGKPDPEPYLAACARLSLPPSAVLAVEDSASGVAAALAAGCRLARVEPAGADIDALIGSALAGKR
jgi:HAD superfamily hydrolase (TIGR01509 family)